MTYGRAMVTGASSGIGEALARRLAGRGTDLVLVARRRDRLDALAAELSARVAVEVVVADLATEEGVTTAEARLGSDGDGGSGPVDLLVNNAGFGSQGPFAEADVDREEEQIRLNVVAVVRLTRAALPGMLERRAGAVVNVSSVAGFVPTPAGPTYGATKAFVTSFTEALSEQVRGSGVRLLVVCPGYTRSEFHASAGVEQPEVPEALWQRADEVAGEALAALDAGRVVVTTGLQNRSAVALAALLPRVARRRMAGVLSGR